MQYGYQKRQTMKLISNLLKKLQKDSCEKSYQPKSIRKIEFFYFYYYVQKFSAFNYF